MRKIKDCYKQGDRKQITKHSTFYFYKDFDSVFCRIYNKKHSNSLDIFYSDEEIMQGSSDYNRKSCSFTYTRVKPGKDAKQQS